MRLKHSRLIFSLLLLVSPFAASATNMFAPDRGDTGSLNQFPIRVLPVLVQVDAKGQVTRVAPAYQLSPRFNRLLGKNISEMISRPAVNKHGNPMSSQFVLNLVLNSTPRDDGSYDIQFRYASTQPVPSGRWGWSHVDGHELALLDLSRPTPRRAPVTLGSGHDAGPMPMPTQVPAAPGGGMQSQPSPAQNGGKR
jgi:hypothetical protein